MKTYKEKIYEYYFTKRVSRSSPKDISDLESRQPFYQNLIDNYFPMEKDIKIVDLGCGYGAFVYCIRKNGYKDSLGVDASSEMVGVAEYLNIDGVRHGDIVSFLNEQPDESIDVLTAIDLIEHFSKQELFELVAQFYRVLKKGGRIITHQPNAEGVFGNAIHYGDYTHEQSFTRVSIAQVFLSNGFNSIISFEDKPLRHSLKSNIRRILWDFLVRPFYLFLIAVESGGSDKEVALTKNFFSIAVK